MDRRNIREIAMDFAVEIAEMCQGVKCNPSFINQLLRSSSSIGANSYEAKYAQSDADFVSKYEIALKECNETEYWLTFLYRRKAITTEVFEKHRQTCSNLRRKIIASIKTVKARM